MSWQKPAPGLVLAVMKPSALLLILATLLLAGCSDGAASYYHKHPHKLMHEVVRCENNGGALANTPACRRALALNAQLF